MNGLTSRQCEAVMEGWSDGIFREPWTLTQERTLEIRLGDFVLSKSSGGFHLVLPDGVTTYKVKGCGWSYGLHIHLDGWDLYIGRDKA